MEVTFSGEKRLGMQGAVVLGRRVCSEAEMGCSLLRERVETVVSGRDARV